MLWSTNCDWPQLLVPILILWFHNWPTSNEMIKEHLIKSSDSSACSSYKYGKQIQLISKTWWVSILQTSEKPCQSCQSIWRWRWMNCNVGYCHENRNSWQSGSLPLSYHEFHGVEYLLWYCFHVYKCCLKYGFAMMTTFKVLESWGESMNQIGNINKGQT